MSQELSFAMVGASGRMGQAIISLAESYEAPDGSSFRLVGALDRPDSEWIGRKLAGGVAVTGELEKALGDARVVIDFSSPLSSLRVADFCGKHGTPLVIGTTGFTEAQNEVLDVVSKQIPLLVAPNMSVGVNLLFELTRLTARILKSGYDIEVVEAHHHFKKDAPSGTAMRLKQVLLDELQRKEKDVIYGRKGLTGERSAAEIGMHTLRGGDVVGDHTVYFFGEGERIELTHRASSRATFASGALQAAAFLSRQEPGTYRMRDVLGLDAL